VSESREAEDQRVAKLIEEFLELMPQSGYRSTTDYLNKTELINKKKVSRIMRKKGLTVGKKKAKHKHTTNSNHKKKKYPNLLLNKSETRPVIVGDITYFDIKGQNHYLALLMDLTNREVVGWAISEKIDADLVCAAFKCAISTRSNLHDYIHHTDTDVRYCSDKYIKLLNSQGIAISMCKGNAYENAHAESLNGTIKRQEINLQLYESKIQSAELIGRFIGLYNSIRPHSALDGLSPLEFSKKLSES
jgi:transposase InsO family protein